MEEGKGKKKWNKKENFFQKTIEKIGKLCYNVHNHGNSQRERYEKGGKILERRVLYTERI